MLATLTIVPFTLISNPLNHFQCWSWTTSIDLCTCLFQKIFTLHLIDWGTKNLVQFNASKTQSCSVSHKKSTNIHPIFMNGASLQNKESFNLVGVAFEHDLSWHAHITSIATSAAKKLGFLFQARRCFSSLNLYTLYVSQIRPCLEYCSHVWGATPPSTPRGRESHPTY